MKITDLIPSSWNRREARRGEGADRIGALQLDIDRAFGNFWRAFDLPTRDAWDHGLVSGAVPRVDVRDTEKEVVVEAELPGMDESDVDVSVAEGTLAIRGEKKAERATEKKGYVLHERSFGRIERVVPLPEGLEVSGAQATFRNGVLAVTIPKTADAQAATKHIPVQRG